MGYCSTDQVGGEFKKITFGEATPVTVGEVERFISEESSYIDALIGNKYQVPVLSGDGLLVLRKICIILVASRIRDMLRVKTGDDKSSQDGGGVIREKAEKMLENIVLGRIKLIGATLISSFDGVQSYNAENEITGEIDVSQTQW